MAIRDLTNQRFGLLVALERAGRRRYPSGNSKTLWRCLCDCGEYKVVSSPSLCCGKAKSCGCRRKNYNDSAFTALYRHYRSVAHQRHLEFSLTEAEFKAITGLPCSYCGAIPAQCFRQYRGTYIYNGIDRLDNNLGYTVVNSTPCCGTCNRMKMAQSPTEFLNRVGIIYRSLAENDRTEPENIAGMEC